MSAASKEKTPPDRLSVHERKPFFDPDVLKRGLLVSIDGVAADGNVVEYCVSGKWARVHVKNHLTGQWKVNFHGRGLLIKRLNNVKIAVRWKDSEEVRANFTPQPIVDEFAEQLFKPLERVWWNLGNEKLTGEIVNCYRNCCDLNCGKPTYHVKVDKAPNDPPWELCESVLNKE